MEWETYLRSHIAIPESQQNRCSSDLDGDGNRIGVEVIPTNFKDELCVT